MPLEPQLPLFHQLDREWFDGSLAPDGQRLVELRWSDGRSRRLSLFPAEFRLRPQRGELARLLERPGRDPAWHDPLLRPGGAGRSRGPLPRGALSGQADPLT